MPETVALHSEQKLLVDCSMFGTLTHFTFLGHGLFSSERKSTVSEIGLKVLFCSGHDDQMTHSALELT